MSKMDASTFYTITEVAEILRVSKMTVYRFVHAGELDAVRVGRNYRVHEKSLRSFLDKPVVEEQDVV